MVRRCFVHSLGMVTALGLSTEDTWREILAGNSGISLHGRFDGQGQTLQARLPDQLPKIAWPRENRKKASIVGPFHQVAAPCLSQLDVSAVGEDKTVGLSVSIDPVSRQIESGSTLSVNPANQGILIPYMQEWGFSINGPLVLSSSNCASGLDAIGNAYEQVCLGNADIMIAGGSQVLRDGLLEGAFRDLSATTASLELKSSIMPFDMRRSGTVLGEGGAYFVLTGEETDSCFAEIIAFQRGAEQYGLTEHDPSGAGLKAVFERALRQADIKASDLGYINVHGTGTVKNDPVEANGIRAVCGEALGNIFVGGTKQATGHLNYASGALEAAIIALVMRDQVIPPHLFLNERDELFDGFLVPSNETGTSCECNYIATISLGFGGFISVMIMRRVR